MEVSFSPTIDYFVFTDYPMLKIKYNTLKEIIRTVHMNFAKINDKETSQATFLSSVL